MCRRAEDGSVSGKHRRAVIDRSAGATSSAHNTLSLRQSQQRICFQATTVGRGRSRCFKTRSGSGGQSPSPRPSHLAQVSETSSSRCIGRTGVRAAFQPATRCRREAAVCRLLAGIAGVSGRSSERSNVETGQGQVETPARSGPSGERCSTLASRKTFCELNDA